MNTKHDIHMMVNRIQALWRGYTARKKLFETRTEYLAIFKEIEGDSTDVSIEWPYKFCAPMFRIRNKIGNTDNPGLRRNSLPNSTTENDDQIISDTSTPRDINADGNMISTDSVEVSKSSSQTQTTDINCSSNEHITELDHKDISCQTSICFDEVGHDVTMQSSTPRVQSVQNVLPASSTPHVQSPQNIHSAISTPCLQSPQNVCFESSTPRVQSPRNDCPVSCTLQNNSDSEESNECNSQCERNEKNKHKIIRSDHTEISGKNSKLGKKDTRTTENVNIQNSVKNVNKRNTIETNQNNSENNQKVAENVNNRNNILTDSWMSDKSFCISDNGITVDGKSASELCKMKEELSLELLWIGQAISSRKTYLSIKNKNSLN